METASVDQKSGFSSPDFEQLAKDAVSSWSLDLDELSLIKQRENAVFSLRTRDGQRYALRVHRSGYHTDAELRSEIEWMRSLKAHGVKTADVIPTLDGQGFTVVANHQIDLLQWIDAAPIGAIEEQNRDAAELSNAYRQVGAIMAQMHDHAAAWSLPGGFERHAWDEDGLVGPEPFWGNFLALDVLNDDNRALLQKAAVTARADLQAYGKERDRYGLIHADTLPENFLATQDNEIFVIDFDDGGFGWYLFDFATALFFHLGEPQFEAVFEALTEGYARHRALPPEFENRLDLFFLLRGLTYLGWAHTRRETETAQEMAPMITTAVLELAQNYLAQK